MTGAGDLVLGIDASTTACKAVVWNLAGEAVAEGRADLPLLKPRPLWHEQPAEAWWTALCDAVRGVLATQPKIKDRIAALCIAPQRETFVPVDAAGEPLRHAIVWMDERSGSLLPRIAREYGAERVHQETGKPLSGNLALPKILWLRENEPAVFAATARYLDVAGFLHQRLTGEAATGWGNVDPMGLFDMRFNTWDAPLLDYLGVEVAQLPVAHPPGAAIGAVTAEAADACGLCPGLPVVAGVGDGQAGGLGADVAEPGRAYLNLGTAVISGTYAADYVVDRAFRTMTGGVPGSYSLETVLLGGTYTVSWFVETFAAEAGTTSTQLLDRYDAALDGVPPGAEGLMLVPYWNSAMNPYWDAKASGMVVGWRGVHTRAHLYRAILEGVAFEQRLHTEGVEAALGEPVAHYVAMGGGARSDRWRQIIADVTGKPVYRAGSTEAAALGAGILAAAGLGLHPDVQTASTAMSGAAPAPLTPDPAAHEFYSRLYEGVYRHLFPALQDSLQQLAAITETPL
jgi:xylulokinase